MPITLTTPKVIAVPGAESITHTQLKIVGFNFPPPGIRIVIRLQYGDTVDDVWVSKDEVFTHLVADTHEITETGLDESLDPPAMVTVVTQEEDLEFTNLVQTVQDGDDLDGLTIKEIIGSFLYAHLLTHHSGDPDYEGTIE